ncbi:hypothetical protein [Thorsellia anophelis]|uniref:Uncharacterized protein n=1 Tax=Thorsellia anophelis DSM 18579 TaxID=1123402 RepID=A0A1I0A8I3_9GAMM|nr:hypothetical protein [Thorsellia anophelis]SES90457.1 hypothetical protein SAMN02583745_00834 [Thorsellia anophelis DSM 18579]
MVRHTLIYSINQDVKQNGRAVLISDTGDINTKVPESDLLRAHTLGFELIFVKAKK